MNIRAIRGVYGFKDNLLPTLSQILIQDQARLIQALCLDKTDARLEAQVLLGRALGVAKSYLIAHSDEALTPEQLAQYQSLIERRLKGKPIAYILGEREFYSLNFKVTPAVLIPRPDTELLVELALTHTPQNQPCQVLDLGTGSGVVAISIAKHRPQASVTAVDQSLDALAVARENATTLAASNIVFTHSDWYSALAGKKFDVIVSNPPYIEANDLHLKQGDLRFEPISALASGEDGLDSLRHIIGQAHAHLLPHGWLLFEHGYNQAAKCRALLVEHGFKQVESKRDLSGIERVTLGFKD